MEQYVRKLYMHDGKMPMTTSMDTPYKVCVSIEDIDSGAKKMPGNATLMKSEDLKLTRPQTCQWTATIMDQGIKQGFQEDWLMSLAKPIHKGREFFLVSSYRNIMVSSVMAKLYSTVM